MPENDNTEVPNVMHQEENSKFFVGETEIGKGVFYVTSNVVLWKKNQDGDDAGKSITLQYKEICMHAISKDLSAFPHECIYIMYNGEIDGIQSDEINEEELNDSFYQIRIVPENCNNLKRIFDRMSDCQCLHNDDEEDSEEAIGEADDHFGKILLNYLSHINKSYF